MDDGAPGLEVGFLINFGDSFGNLRSLDDLFGEVQGRIVAEAARIERATGTMVNTTNATSQISSFGNATTRALQDFARESRRVEASGEALVRQLERQNSTFGMTREQIRATKVETNALAAEQRGLTELATRLRTEQALLVAAEAKRAAQLQSQAAAVKRAADEQDRLAALVRGSQAAQEADAAAAERLRASTDPLYAATKRLNAEIAESDRLYLAGATPKAEYARQQAVLTGRLREAEQAHAGYEAATRKSGFATKQFALQLPDIVGGLLTGQKPMQVAIQQGGQLAQVAQMAEGGVRGFTREIALAALPFAPFIAVLGAATAGFGLFVRWINQGVTNDQLTRDLGKITGGANATKQELYKLREETVTWGDTSKALFHEVGKDIERYFVGDMKNMSAEVKAVLDGMTAYGKRTLAGMYAGLAGTKAYLGELEKGGVKAVWRELTSPGDPELLKRTYGAAYSAADKYLTDLGARVKRAAVENARQRLAEKIGFNSAPKPKVDHHAEQLAREAEATEAQIRNLYKLAEAYKVSDAAALIAEARVKAESQAIKQRGDIEAAVDRQVRLAIAQRVSDGAKGANSMRQQASIQAEVNGMVAAGNIPAERAAQLVQQRIAELPLLQAIEAAQQRGLASEVQKATDALNDQRDAQARVDAAARGAQFVADDAAADRQLALLGEELRLVGASEAARARGLALLRATQDAEAKFGAGTAFAKDTAAKQMQIYDATVAIQNATDDLNGRLSLTADTWDIIAGKVQSAGQGMADAFGNAGHAIGDMASIYAAFNADRARAEQQHQARLDQAKTAEAKQRENQLFALRTSGAQISMYGDLAGAAQGFFKEGTAGYKAMHAAEQVFRLAQLAMSIQAMVQDGLETTTHVANAAARATADGAAGVAAQSKLPFPANIAAMAATAAALVAAGIAIVGGRGSASAAPVTNTGTGTVFGDPAAKSESIKRAIDSLKDVDTLMLTSSREMAASLRSIDSQIGNVAALVVRSGDINASTGVTEGFKTNLIGSLLSKVPVIGGLLGSLFGSKTTVVGSGLFAGAQSLGSILSGGFDASTYSDIEKKKKFLGITTGTKLSTQYGAADAGLENQFTLILRSFNDAITAAAGPLGQSTDAIQQRLNGFVVNIGKIDLKGLTGSQIEEKLSAVFGAAADNMANAAFPGIQKFQKVGEGAFETLVRVSSTVEAVTAALDSLGSGARALGIDAKMGLADQFDSVSDLTSAVDGYFQAFYTKEEQAAAKAAQFGRVFDGLGLAMPSTLAGFRQLVEAQDLTTAAGQATYATLLQLAPAFADLQSAMSGAKSAADILSERQDLERQLLELQGNTAAIRALDLAKLDASNRALQQQIWAVQDAKDAADAANDLREAWKSVGDSIADEVKRIRGLSDPTGNTSFVGLMGQFNAATAAARAGDQDAAKTLPSLSQALLKAAEGAATSRQELARVQAQTASSLEATQAAIAAITGASSASTSTDALIAAVTANSVATAPQPANDDLATQVRLLTEKVEQMRAENTAGHAATAGNTGRTAKVMEAVSGASGGDAISVASAA